MRNRLRQFGDPILHRPGEEVRDFNHQQQQIAHQIAIMRRIQRATNAVGIAANQCLEIEKPLAIILVGIDSQDEVTRQAVQRRYPAIEIPAQHVLINPVIRHESTTWEYFPEGCLSMPQELRAEISRARSVVVSYLDEQGVHHEREKFEGYAARILGHELEHIVEGRLLLHQVIENLNQQQLEFLQQCLHNRLTDGQQPAKASSGPVGLFARPASSSDSRVLTFSSEQLTSQLNRFSDDIIRAWLTLCQDRLNKLAHQQGASPCLS